MDTLQFSSGFAGNSQAPADIRAQLLHLFAPAPAKHRRLSETDKHSLWDADAVHRARNMAQLASSLAYLSGKRFEGWPAHETPARIVSLSNLYVGLAPDEGDDALLPCGQVLSDLATLLLQIFGEERGISGRISVSSLELRVDRRRSLVLLASELMINALKYAFPDKRTGTISVALRCSGNFAELLVGDDGVGMTRETTPGDGTELIEALRSILGAQIHRTPNENKGGLRILVQFPV